MPSTQRSTDAKSKLDRPQTDLGQTLVSRPPQIRTGISDSSPAVQQPRTSRPVGYFSDLGFTERRSAAQALSEGEEYKAYGWLEWAFAAITVLGIMTLGYGFGKAFFG